MNLKDAYAVLGIPMGSTPDETKKQYKKLAKAFHPDVNKAPNAEAKFKEISEAYQAIEGGQNAPPMETHNWGNPFAGFQGFDPFSKGKKQYYTSNIDVRVDLSFKESVQGIKKEIKYSRQIKCPHCNGSGNKPINNGCPSCGGRGQVVSHQQGGIVIAPCGSCHGRAKTNPCNECSSAGVLTSESSVHVTIPAAVVDGNILRLPGMGNFSGSLMGLHDQYTDVHVRLHVGKIEGLRLEGHDVVSDLTVSLLDALRGCTRKVESLDGKKEIEVERRTKNKDEVVLSVGDHNNIKHRIIINVGYPTDIDKLINVLLDEGVS